MYQYFFFLQMAVSEMFLKADLRTKEDGEECEEFLAAEAQVVLVGMGIFGGFYNVDQIKMFIMHKLFLGWKRIGNVNEHLSLIRLKKLKNT